MGYCRAGKDAAVIGTKPLWATPSRLPLPQVALPKPHTPMGLCWCGVTRHPHQQPAPSADGWLHTLPSAGVVWWGLPPPLYTWENSCEDLREDPPKGFRGKGSRVGGCVGRRWVVDVVWSWGRGCILYSLCPDGCCLVGFPLC